MGHLTFGNDLLISPAQGQNYWSNRVKFMSSFPFKQITVVIWTITCPIVGMESSND